MLNIHCSSLQYTEVKFHSSDPQESARRLLFLYTTRAANLTTSDVFCVDATNRTSREASTVRCQSVLIVILQCNGLL